jgi:hypothetical protein
MVPKRSTYAKIIIHEYGVLKSPVARVIRGDVRGDVVE